MCLQSKFGKFACVYMCVCVGRWGGGVHLLLEEPESLIVASCNVCKITEHDKFLFCAHIPGRITSAIIKYSKGKFFVVSP